MNMQKLIELPDTEIVLFIMILVLFFLENY